jgi:hypothetical protein
MAYYNRHVFRSVYKHRYTSSQPAKVCHENFSVQTAVINYSYTKRNLKKTAASKRIK